MYVHYHFHFFVTFLQESGKAFCFFCGLSKEESVFSNLVSCHFLRSQDLSIKEPTRRAKNELSCY
jgi:hypothetical protein